MFELPELAYAESALEPFISGETVQYHHGKHHRKYVAKLNALLAQSSLINLSLPELIGALASSPELKEHPDYELVRFNALQHFNHSLMWSLLGPDRLPPPEGLVRLLAPSYSTWENFEKSFVLSAESLIGSGWVYLTLGRDGGLQVEVMQNADNPIISGEPKAILLACDMWEHSYYLDYQDDKTKYVQGFLRVVDWSAVFQRAMSMMSFFAKDRF